jgi:hypothetical protein
LGQGGLEALKVADRVASKGKDWDDSTQQSPDQAQKQTEVTQQVEAGKDALSMLPDE